MSRRQSRTERGAIVVQTAIAMIGLVGFSAFVVDYGVLWSARRQAQNSADAAALAAASYLAFTDVNDDAGARTAALDAAASNLVWGQSPDVTAADVVRVPCPSNGPNPASPNCVRVDVFRNQRAGGNPLPSLFGAIVGVANQGVRATATAEILYGNTSNCVKPFAIPDKWIENQTPLWDVTDTFAAWVSGFPVPNPDVYVPPNGSGDNGSGFALTPDVGPSDYGLRLVIKANDGTLRATPGFYSPVAIDCTGLACHEAAIAGCASTVVGPGTVLGLDTGGGIHPSGTKASVQALVDLDPYATWDPGANNGRGGISGGCMAASTCNVSPRVMAVPVYDPDIWDQGLASAQSTVTIRRVVGMFAAIESGEFVGYLMPWPSAVYDGIGGQPRSAFVVNVILVR